MLKRHGLHQSQGQVTAEEATSTQQHTEEVAQPKKRKCAARSRKNAPSDDHEDEELPKVKRKKESKPAVLKEDQDPKEHVKAEAGVESTIKAEPE